MFLNGFSIILGISACLVSIYTLYTKNNFYWPFATILLAAFLIIRSIIEIRKDRKKIGGYALMVVAILLLIMYIS